MKGFLALSCLVVLVAWTAPALAQKDPGKWEYRAINLDLEEEECNRRLNGLAADGWEYVGPLTKGNFLFRRINNSATLAAAKEMDLFLGGWVVVTARTDGEVDNEEKGATWMVKNGQIKILNSGPDERLYDFRVDPSRKLKTIDFYRPGKPAPVLGIYEFDGDNLKLCIGDTFNRPTEFSDKDQTLLVLRRRK